MRAVASRAMLVPDHWAEAKATRRDDDDGQVTVRRFGWSMVSEADALAMAEARVAEALARISGGEELDRREPKVPYNGAEGVPIREEVVERRGADVVTRNSYGARCLNTPDVWIADVDFTERVPTGVAAVIVLVLAAAAFVAVNVASGLALLGGLAFIVVLLAGGLVSAGVARLRTLLVGTAEVRARRRLAGFVKRHRDWRVRVYRTPNGLRLIALQGTIAPDDERCVTAFRELGVDPLYAKMCTRQRCYRARLDAKPWRIGIASHMKPRPGVWPVTPERRADRDAWLATYTAAAKRYAACSFEEEIGDGATHERCLAVTRLHDELAGASSRRPIA